MSDKAKDTYTAKSITVLSGLEPVLKRPAMYIGDTGIKGFHHLLWECLDNATDEALGGFCDEIEIEIINDGIASVTDNGRGIPVDIHPKTKKSALETVMTTLHAGGKFQKGVYKVSGGLHGVGVSVVCALSVWMKAEVYRDGKVYAQEYSHGKPKSDVKIIGETSKIGTKITFEPAESVFKDQNGGIAFDLKAIIEHVRQQAYLTKKTKYKIIDKRINFEHTFYFEGGVLSYVKHLNKNKNVLNDPPIYIEKQMDDTLIETAILYSDDFNERIFSFANNIYTAEGGMHVTGFRGALTRAINDYARKQKILKENQPNLTGEDVREGLSAIISVKLSEPQFEGQTKSKLGNPEIKTFAEQALYEGLSRYFGENPTSAKKTVEKCFLSASARLAARAARETVLKKGLLEGTTLPGKLADCSERDPKKSEIFIVEGESAGGCFSGDTKVALIDGRALSFHELISEWKKGKKNYCYTIMKDGEIGINKIENPRLTKKQTKVIKVILDNGEQIVCTPDHKFMLRDGSYIKARNLKSNLSLMPLRKKVSKIEHRITIEGYEMVLNPKTHKWIFTHLLTDRYNLNKQFYNEKNGSHKHHIDFNKRNNNPDNIIRMSSEKHMELHRSMLSKTLHRKDVIEKCNKLKKTPLYRKKISGTMLKMKSVLSKRAKKQWENEEYKQYMARKFLEFYRRNKNYQFKNNKILYKNQKKYWSDSKHRIECAEKVKKYFLDHPEKREELSKKAKKEWQNKKLLEWRSEKTKTQWTREFREKRRIAYNQTYLNESLKFAKNVYEKYLSLDIYDQERVRLPKRNNNLVKLNTLVNRFFQGDQQNLIEAVKNYNHKIKKIEFLDQKIDVYDLEISNTHNFALASGVFVHNSGKQGRDRKFQAILPLRGKILNVERARLDRILASEEIKALIMALGCSIGEQYDVNKLRYHRIIFLADSDVDGQHITTLLLTFFYRNYKDLIERGHIFIGQPPLYKITSGKKVKYAYTEAEQAEVLKSLGKDSVSIQRYKGLGEMNPEQLWQTTLNPENRILKKVEIADAEDADAIFTMLMGADVPPRKRFIQTHAKTVRNLDI